MRACTERGEGCAGGAGGGRRARGGAAEEARDRRAFGGGGPAGTPPAAVLHISIRAVSGTDVSASMEAGEVPCPLRDTGVFGGPISAASRSL